PMRASPAPARDFQLFVGVNITAEFQGQSYQVDDYRHGQAYIRRQGWVGMPINRFRSMRFDYGPKVSRCPITIADLTTQRVVATGTTQSAPPSDRVGDYPVFSTPPNGTVVDARLEDMNQTDFRT